MSGLSRAPLIGRDCFSGAGGWAVAARRLGITLGSIEYWDLARDTASLAGAIHIGTDVRDVDGSDGSYVLEIASPPCERFSTAGMSDGQHAMADIRDAVHRMRNGDFDYWASIEGARHKKIGLVLEPLRVLLQNPHARYATWEQVPSVLAVWEACADVLSGRGWSVATGVLSAEQFGVPQVRPRAVLLARLDGSAVLPVPTHSRYHPATPERIDVGVSRWVGQAEALSLPAEGYIGFPRRADERAAVSIQGTSYRARDLRRVGYPSFVVTGKSRSWNYWRDVDSDPQRITLAQASALQGLPEDYPFQGPRTSQFLQCANAIPPDMAEAILRALTHD